MYQEKNENILLIANSYFLYYPNIGFIITSYVSNRDFSTT